MQERYIGEISKAIHAINGTDAKKLYEALLKQAKRRTAIADAQLDEEGNTVKGKKDEVEELKADEGVVMVESRAAHLNDAQPQPAETAEGDSSDGKSAKPKKKRRSKDQEELF